MIRKIKLRPDEIKHVLKRFGIINPGHKCPYCHSSTFVNKVNQKWCTSCDWSNDYKLSQSLRRIMN